LHDRVEEFVQIYRLTFVPTIVEVIARQELLNRKIGRQTNKVRHRQFAKPLIVMKHLCAFRIENAEGLLGISPGIFHDLFLAQMRTELVFV